VRSNWWRATFPRCSGGKRPWTAVATLACSLSLMQRLLDGVRERWRDAEVAWWPSSATEMWSAGLHFDQQRAVPIGSYGSRVHDLGIHRFQLSRIPYTPPLQAALVFTLRTII
jgi:hypothetical protein